MFLPSETEYVSARSKLKFTTCLYHTSHREKPNKMQQCIRILLLLVLNEARHVSGSMPPIIRSLKLHKQPVVLHTWKVVGRAVFAMSAYATWRPTTARPTTFHVAYATWQRPTTARSTTFYVCKTRGCLCSFRLLMMGGMPPETCRASFKTSNNKILIHCCILLGFSL